MSGSRFLSPKVPGGLLSGFAGLLTSNEALIVQAIENGTYFVFNEVPTGVVDGVNVTFTLAHAPKPTGSEEVYLNGQLQIPTSDYTISGATITFVVAPPGGVVRVNYLFSPV